MNTFLDFINREKDKLKLVVEECEEIQEDIEKETKNYGLDPTDLFYDHDAPAGREPVRDDYGNIIGYKKMMMNIP